MYPTLETPKNGPVVMRFSIVRTPNGRYDVLMDDASDPGAQKICTCDTAPMAASVQRALYEHHMRRITSMMMDMDTEQRESPGLPKMAEGGLPDWRTQPSLPGNCTRCGKTADVIAFMYKTVDGGITVPGVLCRECCESISQLLEQ